MISLDTASIVDDDENDDLNVAAASKNLSSLFDDDPGAIERSKASLFYKRKQPNKKPEESSKGIADDKTQRKESLQPQSSGEFDVHCASAVDVFKLEKSGKYVYISKYGIALLGNDRDASYCLMMYTGKNQPICGAKLNEQFRFVCQPNQYCTFYDDNRQNWSIRFPSTADQRQFCLHIAHAIYKLAQKDSESSATIAIAQDLGFPISVSEKKPIFSSAKMESEQTSSSSSNEPDRVIRIRILQTQLFRFNQSLFGNSSSENVLCDKPTGVDRVVEIPLHSTLADNSKITQTIFADANFACTRLILLSTNTATDSIVRRLMPSISAELDSGNLSNYCKISIELEFIDEVDRAECKQEDGKSDEVKAVKEPRNEDHSKEERGETRCEQQGGPPIAAARSRSFEKNSTNLATRMARMGALPLFPVPQQQQQQQKKKANDNSKDGKESMEKVDEGQQKQQQNSKLVAQQQQQQQSKLSSSTSTTANIIENAIDPGSKIYFDDLFNRLRSDLLDVKALLLKSGASCALSSASSSTMDSEILLASIRKIIDENDRLKREIEAKGEQLTSITAKFVDLCEENSRTKSSTTTAESTSDQTSIASTDDQASSMRMEIYNLKEQIAQLRDEKYTLSMDNIMLEKRILEAKKECTELIARLASGDKRTRAAIKATLNLVYQDFGHAIKRSDKNEEEDQDSGEQQLTTASEANSILSQVLIRVRRQQESKLFGWGGGGEKQNIDQGFVSAAAAEEDNQN